MSLDDVELGESEEELFGADIIEADGGFGINACAIERDDFSRTKAAVLNARTNDKGAGSGLCLTH